MVYTVTKLAKISGVSVRTLHWYDKVGLLKPSYHGANGYRYYEEEQLLMLQQILFFRELGFELKQIEKILGRGDFDKMKERRLVRVLVAHSKTLYFLDRGMERGLDAEYARAFELALNKKQKSKSLKMRVALIPVPRDQLLTALIEGRGDIAMGGMTITPEREALVDFAAPLRRLAVRFGCSTGISVTASSTV